MSNRLAKEPSLYLRQHADNPVDWWPWCPEAFAEAQAKNKPVLVSIGYSACHWCHVMAHESFENNYIAGLMNQHYVCIKVDREERPDVDQIYMEAVQMITQRGGWPLNVFCLPDGRPFFGGTYFPPEDTGRGMMPWPQLLMRISEHYEKDPAELVENAVNIVKNMEHLNTPMSDEVPTLPNDALIKGTVAICETHDDDWGGFGEAPKFPPSMALDFLLALRNTQACEKRPQLGDRIDEVVSKTLKGMAHGGIFDQFGGGFARYSVDKIWLIPHFEKMLYDNALLLDIYARAFQHFEEPLFASIAMEIVEWLEREMEAGDGSFYASLDADSEGEEGKFYVWSPEEVKAVLGEEDGQMICDAYNITSAGTFEKGASNPALVFDSLQKRNRLRPLREKLLAEREKRVKPGKDTKRVTAWNALMIRGLAEAGFALGEATCLQKARRAADWMWETLTEDIDGEIRLKAVYYDGEGPREMGRLDDYTTFAEANLTIAAKIAWLDASAPEKYISRADALMATVLKRFNDPNEPGYFYTADDAEKLPARKKEWFDNASPSGNSCALHALSALHALTGEPDFRSEIERLRQAYGLMAERAPNAVTYALSAFTQDAMGLVVIRSKGVEDFEPLRFALSRRSWRRVFLIPSDHIEGQPEGYQACIGTQCLEPKTDVDELIDLIA